MHLITTHESDLDIIQDKKLYLNADSKKFDQDIKKLNTLPYNWNDIDSAREDADYIYEFYEEIVDYLTIILNQYNDLNLEKKYWKTLIGPWVYYFVTKYYDHYKSVTAVLNTKKNLNINITGEYYIPNTYLGYNKLNNTAQYTSLIYEEIINNIDLNSQIKKKILKKNIYNDLNIIENIKDKKKDLKKFILRNELLKFLKEALKSIINYFFYGKSKNLITLLSLQSKNQDELIHKIGKNKFTVFPYDLYNIFLKLNPKCKIDYDFRLFYKDKNSKDLFKNLFYKNVLKHIPIEYLENFQHNRRIIKKVFSQNTKLAIIRVPTDFKTFNRFYLSEVVNNNGKILSMQHGGAYGVRDIIGTEKLEINLSDQYLTWGWHSKEKNVTPFYVNKDSWIKRYNYNKSGKILYTGASCKNFFYSFDEGQLPNHKEEHIKNSIDFINHLKKSIFKDFVYRFYFQEDFNEFSQIKKIFPNIDYSLREDKSHFYDMLYDSKLLITTNDATTHKQGFIINHPTILLLAKDFFNYRKEASPYYDALYQAGILFYDPILCAKKVNSIASNPMEWWKEKEVQKAKDFYNNYFCKMSKNLNQDLSEIILGMI